MRASFFVLAAIIVVSCGEATVRHEYIPCEADDDCPGLAICEDGICVEYVPVPTPEEGESESESEDETQEVCDGADNDGDGKTDEDFPELGESCDGSDNNACQDGVLVCNADGNGVVCADDVADSYFETCNGLDDDCDGVIDNPPEPIEGFVYCGMVGVCAGVKLICLEDGSWSCDFPETYGPEECSDLLDNDCNGLTDCEDESCATECEGACAVITTPEGEVVEVSGAPRFALHPASPWGAAVPGLGEVLRFTIEVEEGCSAVWIYSLAVRVAFTDNAGSGWTPAIMRLYWNQPGEIMMSQAAWGVLETEEALRYDFAIGPGNMLVEPGLHTMWVTLETIGASSVFDDTIRASLVGPVEFVILEDGARWEMVFDPVVGGILIF